MDKKESTLICIVHKVNKHAYVTYVTYIHSFEEVERHHLIAPLMYSAICVCILSEINWSYFHHATDSASFAGVDDGRQFCTISETLGRVSDNLRMVVDRVK